MPPSSTTQIETCRGNSPCKGRYSEKETKELQEYCDSNASPSHEAYVSLGEIYNRDWKSIYDKLANIKKKKRTTSEDAASSESDLSEQLVGQSISMPTSGHEYQPEHHQAPNRLTTFPPLPTSSLGLGLTVTTRYSPTPRTSYVRSADEDMGITVQQGNDGSIERAMNVCQPAYEIGGWSAVGTSSYEDTTGTNNGATAYPTPPSSIGLWFGFPSEDLQDSEYGSPAGGDQPISPFSENHNPYGSK
ncbi:MAG: hypothetical protein M1820_009231 [Bogoriella megaspora]|nr:MAG: hypothetical protein M1820_009231 [Bogoriella megaspora]